MKKKLLTGILILCMVVHVLPMAAFAAEMITTNENDLMGKPGVAVSLEQPKIESVLPSDATFMQRDVAEQMINPGPLRGALSYRGDFLEEAKNMVDKIFESSHKKSRAFSI